MEINSESYIQMREEYETLLFRRDFVKKEADEYLALYISEFGELTTELFRIKISCIEKKKIIAYCQASINHGVRVDMEQMNGFIQAEMADYNRQLEQMLRQNELCRESKTISQSDYISVKRLYRTIAKKIHPDLNPLTDDSPELGELWVKAVSAYHSNDLEALEVLDIQIDSVLRRLGQEVREREIPDIARKIDALGREIEEITTTDPYQYKFILEDEGQTRELKDDLRAQIEDYKQYEAQLADIIKSLIEGGVQFTWES